jgi:small subunit ribosomal protein S8
MSNNDHLAACLSKINNAEKVSKDEVVIFGISKMIKEVLSILQKAGYLGKIEYTENTKGGMITMQLISRINKCGAIKPRFKSPVSEIEKYEQRYLPAKGFGLLILSTSKGLVTNDAKKNNIGGKVLAYCY